MSKPASADTDPETQRQEENASKASTIVEKFRAPTPLDEVELDGQKPEETTSEVSTTAQEFKDSTPLDKVEPTSQSPDGTTEGATSEASTIVQPFSAESPETDEQSRSSSKSGTTPKQDGRPKPKTDFFKKAVGRYMLVSIAIRGHQMVSVKKAAEEETNPQMVDLKQKSKMERAIAINPEAAMKILQKYYQAEEQHIKTTLSAYSSLKKHIGYVKKDFNEEMIRARKYRPQKQFEHEYNKHMPEILFKYDGVSRPATESASRPSTQGQSRPTTQKNPHRVSRMGSSSSHRSMSGGGKEVKGDGPLIVIEEEV